jgi:hypothetical protein
MAGMNSTTRHFIRHYVEMVVAMFLGMLVLGVPGELALQALGSSTSALRADAPALVFIGMAVTMTVPMVAWMRYRGHGWRSSNEMALSMFIPTFAAIALMETAVVDDFGTLMTLEHIAMFAAMLIAMLLRFDEYTGHHRRFDTMLDAA